MNPQNDPECKTNGQLQRDCSPPIVETEVFDAELEEVITRRRAVGLLPPLDQPISEAAKQDVKDNLVGLALSGGGIRSASFNLGLLQALSMSGVMRHIDYLSTVSGGGYIGALLSSLALKKHKTRALDPKNGDERLVPAPKQLLEEGSPLSPCAHGGQPPEVMQLVKNSHYLNDMVAFANRYFIGTVLNNLAIFSGVVFLVTLFALLWRLLDTPPVVDFILWVSNGTILEWNRPFAPGVLLLILWLLVWLISFRRGGTPAFGRFSGKLLVAAVFCLVAGLAIWLGTPNMNYSNVFDPNFDPKNVHLKNWHQELILPLGILLVLCLIPFIRPFELLKSGTQKNSVRRRSIYFAAGLAFVIGVPFAALYWVGRHNLAGVASGWERSLVAADILNWETFLAKVNNEDKKLQDEKDEQKKKSLTTPGTLFLASLRKNPSDEKAKKIFDNVTSKKRALEYQRIPPVEENWFLWWRQSLPDYQLEQSETKAVADQLTYFLKDFSKELLKIDVCRRRAKEWVTKALKEHAEDNDHAELKDAKKLEDILKDREFRITYRAYLHDSDFAADYTAQTAGHLLLRAFYPDEIRPIQFVSRPLVIVADQRFRLWILLATGVTFLLLGVIVSFNWTSLHGFYRAQLRRTFVAPITEAGGAEREPKLQELANAREGLPYHLLSGSIDLGPEEGPPDRMTTDFLFSKLYCGCPELGFCKTEEYRNGETELSSAVAISGGAISPLTTHELLLRIMFLITNFRLGQWLPNPGKPTPWAPKFVPLLRLLRGWLWPPPLKDRKFVFVADGGFHENLGIEALLDRRCRLIIASDAGADPNFLFEDFVKLYRHCRMHGIQFVSLGKMEEPLAMKDIIPSEVPARGPFTRQHRVLGLIRYPPKAPETQGVTALFIYVKSSISDPETIDVRQYRAKHPDFPHESTVNQFFDAEQFEAYRELGERIGKKLCADLHKEDWEPDPINVNKLIDRLTRKYYSPAAQPPTTSSPQQVPPIRDEPFRENDPGFQSLREHI
jgi:Patatin-like phospholipase